MSERTDSKYPSEEADRFQVRMPSGMRDRIKIEAERNNRSMNAEIVATLEEKYPEPEGLQFEVLLKQQGDLFDRIMEEEDPETKKALTNEFLELRKRVEEIIELGSFAGFISAHDGHPTKPAPKRRKPSTED